LAAYETTIVQQPSLTAETSVALAYWTANNHRAQPWVFTASDVLKNMATTTSSSS
jgi:hypothetical protein